MTTPFKQPQSGQEMASVERCYEITHQDLPLSCPLPSMRLWDAHPKVYLPIEETGEETCPYCGAHYVLVEKAK